MWPMYVRRDVCECVGMHACGDGVCVCVCGWIRGDLNGLFFIS